MKNETWFCCGVERSINQKCSCGSRYEEDNFDDDIIELKEFDDFDWECYSGVEPFLDDNKKHGPYIANFKTNTIEGLIIFSKDGIGVYISPIDTFVGEKWYSLQCTYELGMLIIRGLIPTKFSIEYFEKLGFK